MYLRPLIALVVGAVLFAALAYYAQPLAPESANLFLIVLIGLGGALVVGAAVVIVAGHRRWVWLGGVLSPFAGTVLYLGVFVAPLGGEQGADATSLAAVMFVFLQFLPTALAGSLAAGYLLGRWSRPQSISAPSDSSEGQMR